MNISFPNEVAVFVHSVDFAMKCRVVGIDGNSLSFTPANIPKVDMFQPGDPVVCIYMDNGNLQMTGGDVTKVSNREKIVAIDIAEENPQKERRLFERYPTSMVVSARKKYASRRLHFTARNISLFGLSVVSDTDLDVEELIDIDLITGKNDFYFGGKVVWKKPAVAGFEYGFQLTNFDVATMNNFEAYLSDLKKDYNNLYLRAR
jgi:predicted Zn-dependent protease